MCMLTRKETERLKRDAKTLSDVATMLERDGRFTVLPSVLGDISKNMNDLVRKSMKRVRKEEPVNDREPER